MKSADACNWYPAYDCKVNHLLPKSKANLLISIYC